MTEQNLVVQHNKIIEAKYKLSIGEQRLIKLLVSMIEPEDEDFKVYTIEVSDLIKILGISDGDFYTKVKLWSRKLISNVLIFYGENEEELQVAWLSSAIYKPKKGLVELEFSPKLKPFLLHLKSHFTAYELGNIIRLKHRYSIRIYELLKQYEKIGHRKFTTESLRDLLMLEDHEYKQFSDFRKRILLSSQRELAEKTDISFTWKEEKVKQRCIAIEFTIQSQERKKSVYLKPVMQTEDRKCLLNDGILKKLVDIGVSEKVAAKVINDYDEDRIKSAIYYTELKQKEGMLNNPAGFIIDAIKNKYQNISAEKRVTKVEETLAKEDRERQDQEITNKAALLRRQAIESFIIAITSDQLYSIELEFIEAYKDNAIVIEKYTKKGIENPIVKGCFYDFVFNKKLS